MNEQTLPKLKAGEEAPPGFVGYDYEGRFIHYCHCGAWGAFGHKRDGLKGKTGVWFCREHNPRPA